ncbi:MAG: 23S rRNA (pseudouridine(1915)-N(3))-methyltransferase RlmH [Candidatus Sulfotelmatobacter sp.]
MHSPFARLASSESRLARLVLLQRVYRAFTILKGHPYHSGH